jgi:hypothetical protein
MNCPVCDSYNVKVSDVRPYGKANRRRRKCIDCDYKFTTFELELVHMQELFEKRIKNPEILTAITQVLETEFPAPDPEKRGSHLNGRRSKGGARSKVSVLPTKSEVHDE